MSTTWIFPTTSLARLACAIALAAAASGAPAQAPTPPVARVDAVTDTYFGDKLSDPYRWMENAKDPGWLPYLRQQNAYARAVLEAQPKRAELLARMRQLGGETATPGLAQPAGARLFYQQRPAGANNYKLFVREGKRERVLVDPTQLDSKTDHYSLDWWQPSPDGSKVVYGLSKNGSEDSVLHIIDVKSAKVLKERIPDTQGASPSWLADSSGFFYNQLTGKVDTPERYLNSRARFHKVGSDPAKDPVLMARGKDPAVSYEKIQTPLIFTAPGSAHAVLALADVRQEMRLYSAPLKAVLAGKARWKEVAGFADEVTDFDLHGDELVLRSLRGHPRGRLLKTSAVKPALAEASEVLAESTLVLQAMARASDGLYIRALDGGVSRLLRLGEDGKAAEIPLPFEGTLGQLGADPTRPGVVATVTGWLNPSGIWSSGADGVLRDTGITPKPAIDVSGFTTERRFATAKDGTRIPYSLIYKKGIKLDGGNPAFVQAYGSYGASAYMPAFSPRMLALAEQGVVIGYANVRGGGEFGREWHLAGKGKNKPNTWRDLIAVCEDLQATGYTAAGRLAIGGRSAGGITVGRAMQERPDLFAAVVSGVGWHNPLRYVVEANGYGEEPEWGAIADPEGYRALKSIDSYQHVVDGVRYPAVLLTTGVTDPRVAAFHPAKMAARLQAASASGKPVLLRVDFDAGHGMGSTRAQQDAEAADTFAFVLAHTRAKQ